MSSYVKEEKAPEKVWYGFLDTVMKIPGVKVDRRSFLTKEFSRYCGGKKLKVILEEGTGRAGVDQEFLDKVADGVINYHGTLVIGTSFVAGLPGGFAMIGTIPADIAQYYYHALQVAQKLAYVYGYPDLDTSADDNFLAIITIFIGIMFGAACAAQGIKMLSKMLAQTAVKRIPTMVLTKTAIYPMVKQITKMLGIKVTKQTFARSVGKVIPIFGGVVSAGVTAACYYPSANRLQNALQEGIIR